MTDFSFAVRSLCKDKAFTLAAFLTLALCIGANTALFGFVHTVLLKPLPVPQPDRLVFIVNAYPKSGLPRAGSGVPDYFDRVEGMKTLDSLALYTYRSSVSGEAGRPERVGVMNVTPSYFRVARVQPLLGRAFSEQEGEPGHNDKAILSYACWQERYAGDPAILGTRIRLDDRPFTIVGVMGKEFQLVEPAESRVWIPLAFTPQQKSDGNRHNNSWNSIGRLRDGRTLAQAQAEVDRLNAADVARLPQFKERVLHSGFRTLVFVLQDDMVRNVRGNLYFLWGGTLLVLLIGCANIVNLALVRAQGRLRGLATRLALGAGRVALARHLLAESLLLTVTSGVAGLLLGWASLRLVSRLDLRQIPRAQGLGLDPVNVAFTLGLAILIGIAIGLFPIAAACRVNLASVFHDGGRSASSGRSRQLRRVLVVTQVAVAFMLVVGSGLLISSFRRVLAIDPGFDTTHLLTANVALPAARYLVPTPRPDVQDLTGIYRFLDVALDRLRLTPGVVNAGVTSSIPLSGGTSTNMIVAEGRTAPPNESPMTAMRVQVTPGYLEALRVPLERGRYFDARDTEQARQVALVDTRLAERLWPGQDPIGRRLCQDLDCVQDGDWQTVVGVVGEVKQIGLVADRPVGGVYYYPMRQRPTLGMTFAVRTMGEPAAMVNALRHAVAAADAALPVYRVRTLEEIADDSLLTRRWPMLVTTAFGAVALLLAAIGLYGVLAYLVTQRTREIGIRMALGGTPRAIFDLVLREGLLLFVVGLVGGALALVAARRVLATQLYGVEAGDPGVLLGAVLVLGVVAFLASAIPSLRATRIDPVQALSRE